jgi:Undecaprenyl-phosphate glucose phosphotransferase
MTVSTFTPRAPATPVTRARTRVVAAESKPFPGDRRGPLRPEKLVASRARVAGPALSMGFRILDAVIVVLIAITAVGSFMPNGFADATVLGFVPYGLALAVLIIALSAFEAYAFRPRQDLISHLAGVTGAFVITGALVAIALLSPALAAAAALKLWLATSFAAVVLTHIAAWALVNHLRHTGKLTPNLVIVGGGQNAERLIDAALASGEFAILGLFDDRAGRAKAIKGVTVLGGMSALIDHKIVPFIDRIVICVPSGAQGRVRELISRLSVLPNPITLFVDSDDAAWETEVARLADMPLAYVCGRPANLARAFAKRLQDISIGLLALILLAPLMAAVAIAIRMDSPGPVFFRQRRHGFNNEEITVWKFRSMRTDMADATAAQQIVAGDARVTRIGRFIRRTSIDELPQIFNVLTGEMSLVGPRPHAIGMKTGDVESAKLVTEYAHRHRMKPGMTGWAAIHGSRGPVDTPALVRQRVSLDVAYIERQSFWLDLYIMAMTIPCLLGDSETVR